MRIDWMSSARSFASGVVVAAFLFGEVARARDGGAVEEARLFAADAAVGDQFGRSVAIDGDTAVVGTLLGDGTVANAGAAYVFVRSGTTWTQQAKLEQPAGDVDDYFGIATAVQGDTLVVGARGDDDLGTNAGTAYVYVRSGTTWSLEQKLLTSDGQGGDGVGWTVGIDGDSVALGSRGATAYVFTRSGSVWTEQQKLLPVDGPVLNSFGWSIAIDGDTCVVGARRDFDVVVDGGSAYVFTRSGALWSQEAELRSADLEAGDQFGWWVSLDGDTLAVSALEEDENGAEAGAAYVFVRAGTTWSQQAKLLASDGEADDLFSSTLDLDGDALILSNRLDDDLGTDAGAAYVFRRTGTAWTQRLKLVASDGMPGDVFGWMSALQGDTALIGARFDDTGVGAGAGSAYVFRLPVLATTYCTGKTNSAGCMPFLSAAGIPSATLTAPFQLRAGDVAPSESGFLIYSFKKANLDFHGGKLCIKAPIVRTASKAAKSASGGCSPWSLARNFNATIQSGIDPILTPGQNVFAQWRQRDPSESAGFGDGLTNAVRFVVCP